MMALPNYTLLTSQAGHFSEVTSLKFSPNGKWLASGAEDGLMKMWDGEDGHFVKTILGHRMCVTELCWSSDSLKMASSSKDTSVKMWDANTSKCLYTLKGHVSEVRCSDFSVTFLIASGSLDGSIRVWDAKSKKSASHVHVHTRPVTSVRFNPDASQIVSSGLDGKCQILDVRTWTCLKVLSSDDKAVSYAEFSPSGKFVLKTSMNDTIELWDANENTRFKVYAGHKNSKYRVNSNFATTGRKMVVSGSEDHVVYLWDLSTGEIVQRLVGHEGPVVSTACHPKQNVIASSALGKDKAIKFWKSNT